MEDRFDAVLYLGPPATTFAKPSKATCGDATYLGKRLARMVMLGSPPAVIEQMKKACDLFSKRATSVVEGRTLRQTVLQVMRATLDGRNSMTATVNGVRLAYSR